MAATAIAIAVSLLLWKKLVILNSHLHTRLCFPKCNIWLSLFLSHHQAMSVSFHLHQVLVSSWDWKKKQVLWPRSGFRAPLLTNLRRGWGVCVGGGHAHMYRSPLVAACLCKHYSCLTTYFQDASDASVFILALELHQNSPVVYFAHMYYYTAATSGETHSPLTEQPQNNQDLQVCIRFNIHGINHHLLRIVCTLLAGTVRKRGMYLELFGRGRRW